MSSTGSPSEDAEAEAAAEEGGEGPAAAPADEREALAEDDEDMFEGDPGDDD